MEAEAVAVGDVGREVKDEGSQGSAGEGKRRGANNLSVGALTDT
jgi:hypothetical protein